MDEKIAVLIPCYNEETTVKKVVSDFKNALPDAYIYVYDNGSSDNTVKSAKETGALVRHEPKRGKGNVIRRMFREVNADCYILVDGDDTYPAEDAPRMAEMVLNEGYDMVIGDRLSSTYREENKRPFHSLGNDLVRGCINHLFGTDITDIMTGYRAFSYLFVKSFPVLSSGFEIETEMTVHAVEHRMNITSIPVAYRDRPEGSASKLNTYSDGAKMLKTIGRLYRNDRPLSFFGILSAIMFAISAAMFIPILIKFVQTGLVPNFPTLIVSGFVALTAIISLFTGLLLSVIEEKDKRDFEFRLMQVEEEARHRPNMTGENPVAASCGNARFKDESFK